MKKVVKERKLILERDYFYPRLLREVRRRESSSFLGIESVGVICSVSTAHF